jgi:transposase
LARPGPATCWTVCSVPDPWRRTVDASVALIYELDLRIAQLTVELRRQGADHRYVPLLITAPGFG